MLEQKGACFINAKGKVWEIGASGLQLWETPERSLSYSDYDELFDAIRKRINAKKRQGTNWPVIDLPKSPIEGHVSRKFQLKK